jgi:hypothetical protein
MPCGWGCGRDLTARQMREHFVTCENKPYGRVELWLNHDGWIYIDQYGRDFGPYATRTEAYALGPAASLKEETTLRRKR